MPQAPYSIRQVVELTGASEFLLRAWELRHGVFRPERTSTGRRRYTAHDVKRARLLLDLTRGGEAIRTLAALPLQTLEQRWAALQPAREEPRAAAEVPRLLALADRFRWDPFSRLLERAARTRSTAEIVLELAAPLLEAISGRVAESRFSVAQEHIVSGLLRQLLAGRRGGSRRKKAMRIVFAAPEGDHHELGLWMGQALAKQRGCETLFLGANMPLRELAETCVRFEATHLMLASTVSRAEGAREELLHVLSFLDQQLPPALTLWVAGRNTRRLPARLKRPFRAFLSHRDFWETLA